ncbi:MAG: PTS glucose transporter subunit IIA [Ignavibacteriales bacterium]
MAVRMTVAGGAGGPGCGLEIIAPLSGRVVDLAEVPDEAFASGTVGPGVAVAPSEGVIVAPVDGVVAAVVSTGHAVGFATSGGIELLVHVGIDTVKVPHVDRFFTFFVKQGDVVERGQPVADFDLEGLRGTGAILISPVVLTAPRDSARVSAARWPRTVMAGVDVVFSVIREGPVAFGRVRV